jgi:protein involved in polysaccharide export with SLBB domain
MQITRTDLSASLKRMGLFLLFTGLLGITAFSQKVSPAIQQKALQEIQSRGLDEAEVRAKLKERGIDIDNVTADQLPTLQPVLEEVIKELEAEKAAKQTVKPPADTLPPANKTTGKDSGAAAPADLKQISSAQAFRIQEKINQGKSIQEAISEELGNAGPDSVPKALVYGQELFRDKSLALFRTISETKPPDTYVLSTGDVLTISIFGASQFDNKFEINKDGFIQPSAMPKIFLKGVRLGQAKELLRSRFAQAYVFRPEQFAVNLTTARAITVNIFGETAHYGSFSIAAVNTAFNALVAAGGPTNLGSVRNIRVIRGKTSRRLDVYEFMNNPAVQYDFYLEDNDIIHVPVAERVVGIRGAVNRAYQYELIEGENLKKLIGYAGGFSAGAYREELQVRRFVKDRQVLIDVHWKELEAQGADFTLQNGDEVLVKAITAPVDNTVAIEGAVVLPGVYALNETPRLSDLLKKGTLKPESRKDVAFLVRMKADKSTKLLQLDLNEALAHPGTDADPVLQPKDRLMVYALSRFTDKNEISVTGAVRAQLLKYPYSRDSSMTLQRAILLAGGLKTDANGVGYILRSNIENPKEKRYLSVDLMAALRDAKSKENIVLQPEDQLVVLSQISFTDASTIKISGAVRQPGEFQFGQQLNLREAILFAGGFRLEAARNRIDIYRVQMVDNKPNRTEAISMQVDSNFFTNNSEASAFRLYPFDEVVVRTVPAFEFQRFVVVRGEVRYPGRYALVHNNEKLSELITEAGGLTEESFPAGATMLRGIGKRGYVVTDLEEAMRDANSPHNHILHEGDTITIPKREDLVSISIPNTRARELYANRYLPYGLINVAYHPGRRAGWYIKNFAAGFGKEGLKSKVTVLLPNGKINRTWRFFGIFRVYPRVSKGAVVSVGSKAERPVVPVKEKKEINWDKALTQILATVGTLATVTLAVTALKK